MCRDTSRDQSGGREGWCARRGASALLAMVLVVLEARGASAAARPLCPPPPGRCKYDDSMDKDQHYYYINDEQQHIKFTGTYLRLTCEKGLTLEDAPLPRFPQRTSVPRVILAGCPAPHAPYLHVLDRLNVTVLDRLDVLHVPPEPPLRADHLAGLHHLPNLEVSAERDKVLEPHEELLSPLLELRKLWLSSVRLKPAAVGSLPSNLTFLSLVNCELSNVSALARLKELKNLVLWDKTIKSPPPVDKMPALRILAVDAPLEELPPFEDLENVTLANVRNVTLRGSCASLQQLHVRSSRLTALPEGWLQAVDGGARCPRLHDLLLKLWSVESLPTRLLAGDALHELTVIMCSALRTLPEDLFNATRNLGRLNIKNNKALTDLPNGIFSGLLQLEELDLSSNKLRDGAPGGKFAEVLEDVGALSTLRKLVLDHNEIGDMCIHALGPATPSNFSPLQKLYRLQELSLAHTGASRFCDDWKDHLPKLTIIDFSYNKLTILTYSDMQWYESSRMINMEGNPLRAVNMSREEYQNLSTDTTTKVTLNFKSTINCTCDTYWMARALQERRLQASLTGVHCSDKELASARLDIMTCDEPALCDTNCTCTLRPGDTDTLAVSCRSRHTLPDLSRAVRRAPRVELYLAGNNVRSLPDALPPRLQLLDLRNNSIAALPARTAAALFAHSRHVFLAGNPLACTCDINTHARPALLRELLMHPLTSDPSELTCVEDGMHENVTLPCKGPVDASGPRLGTWLWAVVGTTAGVVLAMVLAWAMMRREGMLRVKVFMFTRRLLTSWVRPNDDDDSKYDVYIAFSRHDFSIAEQIIAELESGPRPLRVCSHHRDWRVGDWISAQIARSVRQSRRTVVLVSEHFARSTWARAVLREATARALRDAEPRLVVVRLQRAPPAGIDSELRHYITSNTYVRWGEPAFWDRLRLALPPGRPHDERTPPSARLLATRPGRRSPPSQAAKRPALPVPLAQQPSPPTPVIKLSQMDFPSPIKKHVVVKTSP